ncbi:hypothetical protein ACHHRT_09875 [Desulfurivibrio sp. D14AmB]|uniref:hypothetical protein n=1 Tax=Desulfurivibrio sp. D14AmB TaxID=3374370 RepID=UPI00376F3211
MLILLLLREIMAGSRPAAVTEKGKRGDLFGQQSFAVPERAGGDLRGAGRWPGPHWWTKRFASKLALAFGAGAVGD